MSQQDQSLQYLAGLEQENSKLRQEIAALRRAQSPETQKLWVLVCRGSWGVLTAEVFTDPADPRIELRKREAGPGNYVEIYTSIPIP